MVSMHSLCSFTSAASYLDLLFTRYENENVTTKPYGKADSLGFHIVNFLFMFNNVPSALVYGVYAFAVPIAVQIIDQSRMENTV